MKKIYLNFLPFSVYIGSVSGICYGLNNSKNYNNLNIIKYSLYGGFISIFFPLTFPIIFYKYYEYNNKKNKYK